MQRPLRFGLVGLGAFGRHHARVLATTPGIALVGVVDPAGDVHGARPTCPIFAELEPLLRLDLDAAVVATPPSHHRAVALRLAAAGIPTLIEKPLAPSLAEAEQIQAGFASGALMGAVGHVERFNPAAVALRATLGGLGPLASLSAHRAGPRGDRAWDVGVAHDLAIHDLDLLAWLGGGVTSIEAEATADRIEAAGRLGCGAGFTLLADAAAPARRRRLMVEGAEGALEADLIQRSLIRRAGGVAEVLFDGAGAAEPLRAELEGFRDAILGRAGARIVSLAEGVTAVALAEAVSG